MKLKKSGGVGVQSNWPSKIIPQIWYIMVPVFFLTETLCCGDVTSPWLVKMIVNMSVHFSLPPSLPEDRLPFILIKLWGVHWASTPTPTYPPPLCFQCPPLYFLLKYSKSFSVMKIMFQNANKHYMYLHEQAKTGIKGKGINSVFQQNLISNIMN